MQEPFSPNDVEPIGSICQMLLAGLDPGDLTLRDVAVLRDNDIRVMGRSGVYWLEFLYSFKEGEPWTEVDDGDGGSFRTGADGSETHKL